YPLTETPSSGYSQRTKWNVRDSDGTLILSWGEPTGGTLLAANECRRAGKPHLLLDLDGGGGARAPAAPGGVAANLAGGVLNVAGPRASRHPELYEKARAFVLAVLGGDPVPIDNRP